MALILNIDTSSYYCSVAVAKEGEVIVGYESSEKMDHSSSLAIFVKKCFDYIEENNISLDAVSVSSGPGSYTGLRIGLSMAKGLAFGLDIPLITLSSLKVMAVRAIFTYDGFSGNEIIVPMIDARRMEVYTGVYDSSLKLIKPELPLIIDQNSLSELEKEKKVIFIGDGILKFKNIYNGQNAIWLGTDMSHAKFMAPLSEKYFKDKIYSDLAYSVPRYLKEYQATTPKRKL